jgi:hypothetical protein
LGPSAANRASAFAAVKPDRSIAGAGVTVFIAVIHHAPILALQ